MQAERQISMAPRNAFDTAELALIEMSRFQRRVWRDRWAQILINAGEIDLAETMAAEARSSILGARP